MKIIFIIKSATFVALMTSPPLSVAQSCRNGDEPVVYSCGNKYMLNALQRYPNTKEFSYHSEKVTEDIASWPSVSEYEKSCARQGNYFAICRHRIEEVKIDFSGGNTSDYVDPGAIREEN